MAYSQLKLPQISWNVEYTKVSYKKASLELSVLRQGIKCAIADVWKLMDSFTQGKRLAISIPDDACCDKNNPTWGDTWIRPEFTELQTLPLIAEMEQLGTWDLSTASSEGAVQWNIANCRAFMDKMKDIVRLLGFLNYFVPGPPSRGTELVVDRIYTTQVKRNFYLDFGWMLIARRYSKTNSITGRDNLTVAYMPKQLAEVNQYYQLFFRPIEQLIATQLYPKEEVSHYHEFMYVLCGKRWTAEQFRDYIPKISTKYFSSPLKVSYLRHLLIAVKRAFIPPILTDLFQDIGDRISAHSTQIASAWYAVEDALEGKTTTFMSDTREWCRQYHDALGIGESEDIPIPIRFQARPLAVSTGPIGNTFQPSADQVFQLQQTIIHLFTTTAQDMKLIITQEMQEAIYQCFAQGISNFQLQNLTTPPLAPPRPHLPSRPSDSLAQTPSSTSQSNQSLQRGRVQQQHHHHMLSTDTARHGSSGSRKRKVSPSPSGTQSQTSTPVSGDEWNDDSYGTIKMSELSIGYSGANVLENDLTGR